MATPYDNCTLRIKTYLKTLSPGFTFEIDIEVFPDAKLSFPIIRRLRVPGGITLSELAAIIDAACNRSQISSEDSLEYIFNFAPYTTGARPLLECVGSSYLAHILNWRHENRMKGLLQYRVRAKSLPDIVHDFRKIDASNGHGSIKYLSGTGRSIPLGIDPTVWRLFGRELEGGWDMNSLLEERPDIQSFCEREFGGVVNFSNQEEVDSKDIELRLSNLPIVRSGCHPPIIANGSSVETMPHVATAERRSFSKVHNTTQNKKVHGTRGVARPPTLITPTGRRTVPEITNKELGQLGSTSGSMPSPPRIVDFNAANFKRSQAFSPDSGSKGGSETLPSMNDIPKKATGSSRTYKTPHIRKRSAKNDTSSGSKTNTTNEKMDAQPLSSVLSFKITNKDQSMNEGNESSSLTSSQEPLVDDGKKASGLAHPLSFVTNSENTRTHQSTNSGDETPSMLVSQKPPGNQRQVKSLAQKLLERKWKKEYESRPVRGEVTTSTAGFVNDSNSQSGNLESRGTGEADSDTGMGFPTNESMQNVGSRGNEEVEIGTGSSSEDITLSDIATVGKVKGADTGAVTGTGLQPQNRNNLGLWGITGRAPYKKRKPNTKLTYN